MNSEVCADPVLWTGVDTFCQHSGGQCYDIALTFCVTACGIDQLMPNIHVAEPKREP